MAKKTLLMLPNRSNEIVMHIESNHQRARLNDVGVTAEGAEVRMPSSSFRLPEAQTVTRVTVNRDADGNTYITLEE